MGYSIQPLRYAKEWPLKENDVSNVYQENHVLEFLLFYLLNVSSFFFFFLYKFSLT